MARTAAQVRRELRAELGRCMPELAARYELIIDRASRPADLPAAMTELLVMTPPHPARTSAVRHG